MLSPTQPPLANLSCTKQKAQTGPEEPHAKKARGEGMLMQPSDPHHMEVKARNILQTQMLKL